jgi:hypothetical protein
MPQRPGFKGAVFIILAMIATGIIAQNLFDWLSARNSMQWAGVAAAILLFGIYIFDFWKSFNRLLHTAYFAISILISLALATAIGTFIAQNPGAELLLKRYGEAGSKVINFLMLDDIFHSWWYIGLFILLLVSLVRKSFQREFSKQNLGFHLAHLSPLIIVGGVWYDYFFGFKGMMHLEVGEVQDSVEVYDVNFKYISRNIKLPFKLRLDSFASQKHEPDHRIQIWEMDSLWQESNMSQDPPVGEPPRIVASLPLTIGKINRIYGTDVYFRTTKVFPNFTFDYIYPVNNDTVAPTAPGIFVDLMTEQGSVPILFRDDLPERNKLADLENIGAWLEFYYELPEDVRGDLKKAKTDPNRIIFSGKEAKIYFLINGVLTEKPIKVGEFHPFPKGDNPDYGFSVRYQVNNAELVRAEPSSDGEEWLNPVAFVEVWRKGQQANEVYIYSTTADRRGGNYQIPGAPYFLALESVRDMETKYWRSDISVLDESGKLLKQKVVKVNEILLHDGYRFYQNDYDPNNPNYSGIGVSKEPGLYIIYFGFFLMVAGSFIMLYYRLKPAEEVDSTKI